MRFTEENSPTTHYRDNWAIVDQTPEPYPLSLLWRILAI
jgi:hypothetical protein